MLLRIDDNTSVKTPYWKAPVGGSMHAKCQENLGKDKK